MKGWVENAFFLDYDGYGDVLDLDLEELGRFRPSTMDDLPSNAEWIVWYNR